ncbi:GDP-mannose 4,6-dehydratase [Geosporobacter ferrireducens]|uniref:Epimerase n=1 Tax=Geosporobacter ferrireducens TaxID=1424294 RepID=A0A1D8GKU6_9FIRM|nr:GDP-mannose 4,6-dehydratase [Geosporobacter ferrireducens]AOT71531.1 epimerase [Geosporobacter ferrireducens]
MSTILVTGGAGFIGSSLIDELLRANKKVVAVDNFNNYYNPKIKENYIKEILYNMTRLSIEPDNFTLYREDIRNRNKMEEIFKKHEISIIIHLAAMAGVRSSIENPDLYYDININGTLTLLEAARKNGVDKFIFASSSSVYGNNKKVPFREDDPVDQPISPYAASKKAGELICYTYHHLYEMSIACLRFFTVYGPRQRPDLAINKFTQLIMTGQPIPVYGNGSTQRDYTFIGDIIDGIMKTIDWINKEEKQYEIFNLGESKTITLNEMIATIERALDIQAVVNRLPIQPGDVDKTFADILKAKAVLGYQPGKTFEDGINDYIKWLMRYKGDQKGLFLC